MPLSYSTYAELFAGVGGWGAALPAHLRPIFAIEKDPRVASWYRANHPKSTLVLPKDIAAVNPKDLPTQNIDILFASPPCQAFSNARTKLTARPDTDIGWEIIQFVKHLEPKLIFIENVANYLNYATARRLIARLRYMDYNVTAQVIDAWDYGVPQDRRRAIMVASREYEPEFPISLNRQGWMPTITSDDYEPSSWMPSIARHVPTTDQGALFTHLANDYHKSAHKLAGRWTYTMPLDRDEYTAFLLPTGNTTRDITWRANFHPATTVTARCGGHHYRIIDRRYPDIMQLSMAGLAKLQTFPPYWKWPEGRAIAGHLIGNAVPPLLSQRLVRHFTS